MTSRAIARASCRAPWPRPPPSRAIARAPLRAPRCRVPWCGPVAVGRDVWPSPPVGAPHPPGSRRRASARCAAWQVAHAESFACRGSVRGTVRGRAAHPARDAITNANYVPLLHPRGALAYYPSGAMGTSRPTAITPANGIPRHRPRPVACASLRVHRPCPVAVSRDHAPPRGPHGAVPLR